jgi:hypothetical protein
MRVHFMKFTFDVQVVLKGRDFAVTKRAAVSHGEPATWDDAAVRDVLMEILRTIDRTDNPDTPGDRPVALRGFSWIVEPVDAQVVIAIEIPMGAAVAGPFGIDRDELDARIARVLRTEARPSSAPTVH